MKVLLVYPYFIDRRIDEADVSAIPMGLYYVAAMLRANGYAVDILNAHSLQRAPHRIYQVIGEKKPDIVGFSILHGNRWGGIDISRMVKKVIPRATIVFGGVGATFLWEHFLTNFPEIDYVVRGEAEHSFMELIRWLEQSPSQPPTHIQGLAFRQAGIPVKTDDRPPIADLDSLPMPADHFTFQHVSLTRGCPSACTFCGSPALWNRRVRFHSAEYFVTQLIRLRKKGVTFFFVSDDTFTLKRDLVIDICRRIIDHGLDIVWAAISRVDCVDEEILRWMRRAGCSQISYGVESGNQGIRDRFQKHISDEQIHRAFDLTTRTGIMARAYFIYGAPGESAQTIADSLDLLRRIRPLAAIFYMLDLFPGTRIYEDYRRRAGVADDIWLDRIEDIPYFETDETLGKEAVLDFGRQLREGYYALLPQFAQTVELLDDPEFDALHADFLSRLGMTFSHGEYAMNPLVKNNLDVAISLFERSLGYHPDHRAFWGLGLIYQHQCRFDASIGVLEKGIRHHPQSVDLHLALANSLTRLGRHEEAYQRLESVAHHPQVIDQIIRCSRLMGDREKERYWIDRMNSQTKRQATKSG